MHIKMNVVNRRFVRGRKRAVKRQRKINRKRSVTAGGIVRHEIFVANALQTRRQQFFGFFITISFSSPDVRLIKACLYPTHLSI